MGQTNGSSSKFLRFLGSVKLTIILLFLFALAIAAATFAEVRWDTDGARALVYNAAWFELLLGLLVINLIFVLMANYPYRVHQIGYVITHVSFIVVLVSAGVPQQVVEHIASQVGADGAYGVVLEEIDDVRNTGRVRLEKEEWRAESDTDEVIPEGTRVEVVRLEGTHLIVVPLKEG